MRVRMRISGVSLGKLSPSGAWEAEPACRNFRDGPTSGTSFSCTRVPPGTSPGRMTTRLRWGYHLGSARLPADCSSYGIPSEVLGALALAGLIRATSADRWNGG